MKTEWQINLENANTGAFARWARKHQREYDSVFANLERGLRLLNAGCLIGSFRLDFFRSEGGELWRIGQKGVPFAQEIRLYLYMDEEERQAHVLGIGDKASQRRDIGAAKKAIGRMK